MRDDHIDLCGQVDFTRTEAMPLLEREEQFCFACAGCGDCCRGREDIVVSGFDLWRIAARLRLPPQIVARGYCRASIGQVSHLPVLRLAPVKENRSNCPFLTENHCAIHDAEPLDQQADMIVEWMPDAKKVGLLYCSAEANSQYQVDEVQKYLEAKGVTATQYAFSDSNDLSSVCQKAADENDALYVPTDNTVAANTGIVDGICRPAKKPVFAGEEGICSGCGVATLSISYYDLGYTTGEMAVKILNGESDISTMPIEYTDVTKKYNKAICDDLGLTVPEGYEEIEA